MLFIYVFLMPPCTNCLHAQTASMHGQSLHYQGAREGFRYVRV